MSAIFSSMNALQSLLISLNVKKRMTRATISR